MAWALELMDLRLLTGCQAGNERVEFQMVQIAIHMNGIEAIYILKTTKLIFLNPFIEDTGETLYTNRRVKSIKKINKKLD